MTPDKRQGSTNLPKLWVSKPDETRHRLLQLEPCTHKNPH
jgi:hypothetical protein